VKIQVIVFGFGKIAHGLRDNPRYMALYPNGTHFDSLSASPDFEVAAVVDPNPFARQRAERAHVPIVVSSLDGIPDKGRFELAVFAGPPEGRADAIARLPGLRAVVLEKPAAMGAREAARLADETARRGIIVQVGYMRRSDSRFRKIAADGLDNLIGSVTGGVARYGNGARNNASHLVNLVDFLAGKSCSVLALGAPSISPALPIRGDADIAFVASLQNGAQIFYHPQDFSECRELSLELWGTRGLIRIESELTEIKIRKLAPHRLIEGQSGLGAESTMFESQSDAFPRMYEALAGALSGKNEPHCSLSDARGSEAIVDAAFASAQAGFGRMACAEGPAA